MSRRGSPTFAFFAIRRCFVALPLPSLSWGWIWHLRHEVAGKARLTKNLDVGQSYRRKLSSKARKHEGGVRGQADFYNVRTGGRQCDLGSILPG